MRGETFELTQAEVDDLRRQLNEQQPEWISATEAARRLGVNYETVIRNHKELGGGKVGGVWRFPRDIRPQVADPEPVSKVVRRRRKAGLTESKGLLQVRGQGPDESV
ncbi:MAG: helix-turn-helix domain-containing protein [Solirubrobacterales bacterium]